MDIFVDACASSTGSGYGLVLFVNGIKQFTQAALLSYRSQTKSHQAEMDGMFVALGLARKLSSECIISIYNDCTFKKEIQSQFSEGNITYYHATTKTEGMIGEGLSIADKLSKDVRDLKIAEHFCTLDMLKGYGLIDSHSSSSIPPTIKYGFDPPDHERALIDSFSCKNLPMIEFIVNGLVSQAQACPHMTGNLLDILSVLYTDKDIPKDLDPVAVKYGMAIGVFCFLSKREQIDLSGQ